MRGKRCVRGINVWTNKIDGRGGNCPIFSQ
jgi:hypothetical protein